MIGYNLVNLGCGQRYHKDWVNVDFFSNNKDVITTNLLCGIPFPDCYFDVVYHSHLLEHIPKEKSLAFIKECYRVLKPGGLLRVVVPDLENIAKEYMRILNSLESGQNIEEANYEWILLELLDQMVRVHTGGDMANYLAQELVVNEQYVYSRVGHEMQELRAELIDKQKSELTWLKVMLPFSKKLTFRRVFTKIKKSIPIKEFQIGSFRLSGEVHQWMYDRYSLRNLLTKSGFGNIELMDAFSSNIINWNIYELDIKNGIIHKPNSLFMEACKYIQL